MVSFGLSDGWFWVRRGARGGSVFLVFGVCLVSVVFHRLGFGLLRVRWLRLVFLRSAPRVGRPFGVGLVGPQC